MNIEHQRSLRVALGAALLLGLGACTPVDTGFGDSLKVSMASQVIDPDPHYEPLREADGAKVSAAVDRYHTDRVKSPRGIRTTTSIGGAGAGFGTGSGQ